jgi:hypothetical protein
VKALSSAKIIFLAISYFLKLWPTCSWPINREMWGTQGNNPIFSSLPISFSSFSNLPMPSQQSGPEMWPFSPRR